MKILLDTCVWGGVKDVLAAKGHDVEWMGDDEDPGDEDIIRTAHRDGRMLITLDKDFGELAVFREMPHAGIMRLVDLGARRQGEFALAAMARYEREFENGAIVTVYENRVRFRPGVIESDLGRED